MQRPRKKTSSHQRWANCLSADDVYVCLSTAQIMTASEARKMGRNQDIHALLEIVEVFAGVLHQRHTKSLGAADVIENYVIWSYHHPGIDHADLLVSILSDHPDFSEVIEVLAHQLMTLSFRDSMAAADYQAYAIALVAELGIALMDMRADHLSQRNSDRAERCLLLIHMTNSLLTSVTSCDHISVKISLLAYFCQVHQRGYDPDQLGRLMHRFGRTLLEYLFARLLDRKSAAASLAYLQEYLPIVLEGSPHAHVIVHEVLKMHLLRVTHEFTNFIQIFSGHLLETKSLDHPVHHMWLKHLVALLQVVMSLQNRYLSRELVLLVYRYRNHSAFSETLAFVDRDELRPVFLEMIEKLEGTESMAKLQSAIFNFKPGKRGRKPGFKSGATGFNRLSRLAILGGLDIPKAS